MRLLQLIERLHSIYPAQISEPYVLVDQMTPALLDLFERHGEIVPVDHVVHVPGKRRLQCMKAALTYAMEHPSATPFLGFGLYMGGRDATEKRWSYHAWCLEEDGTVIDSSFSPYLVAAYGLRYGREVYQALPRSKPLDQVPSVLQRSFYSQVDQAV